MSPKVVEKKNKITPVNEMSPLEKIFLGAVALVGFVNLGFIGMVARSIYLKEAVPSDVFNGVLLALILQAILVNTAFVWRISANLDK
jgi:hypothetical protein